jgi:regulator of sigma E protease
MEGGVRFSLYMTGMESVVQQLLSSAANVIVTAGAFLLMLSLLVIVHELGHLWVGLRMGITVEEFGLGYPPRAATLFTHRGIRYTLNWLPLGGFVRFAGMDGTQETLYGTGSLAAAPPWRKIPVMLAGPLMNFLLAIVIFGLIFSINGRPVVQPGLSISAVYPATPAEAAGISAGDVLLQIDGTVITAGSDIGVIARSNAGRPLEIVIERDGAQQTLTLTPGPWTAPDGAAVAVGYGFSYGSYVVNEAVSFPAAMVAGVQQSIDLTGQMFAGLAQLPAAVAGMFSNSSEAAAEPLGPIGIARATGEVIQQPGGMLAFWNLTALLSLNLFILNLLPIPALDGSHILFSLVEWARGKKLPPEKEAFVHAMGFMALMGLMVLITVNDVINAVSGTPIFGN